jgi:hypothetical protein
LFPGPWLAAQGLGSKKLLPFWGWQKEKFCSSMDFTPFSPTMTDSKELQMIVLLPEWRDLRQFKPRMFGNQHSPRKPQWAQWWGEAEGLTEQFHAGYSTTKHILGSNKVLLHICFQLMFTTLQRSIYYFILSMLKMET